MRADALRIPRAPAVLGGAAVLAAAVVLSGTARAQEPTLPGLDGLEDGTARIRYAARPGVETCRDGIRMDGRHLRWRGHGHGPHDCRAGPLVVEVTVRDGRVEDIDVLDGSRAGDPSARDLGDVTAADAVRFLAGVARGGGSSHAARAAVLPALLAGVEEPWRMPLELARDRSAPGIAREAALFWLGQVVAAVATAGLAEVARDEDEGREIRKAAVFALSRRPGGEGVPTLMDVATTARDPDTRRAALFWLAQSDDERVVAFFERILTGGRGGA